jgi:hypothetical protein
MTQFEIDGRRYTAGAMNAMEQAELLRRVEKITRAFGNFKHLDIESQLLEAWSPVIDAIAELPDVDVEYVFDKCLSCITPNIDRNDIDLTTMLAVVVKMISTMETDDG